MQESIIVEMIRVSKSYDKQKNVIKEMDLTIREGEFFVLVGPSGSGKSTLLRMIAGLEDITGGILKIGGRVVNHLPPKDRNISMVFQNYALYPHLNVEENILFGLKAKKVDKGERQRRLQEAAEMLGLERLLKRKPKELSGGQRQRVALARAIVSRAPLCLMDEPLSNLDAKLRANMRMEIRRLQQRLGLTTIYVTHDQVEAMTMGDRIIVLHDGKIQQVGEPIRLYNEPANTFVASFIGTPKMNMGNARYFPEKRELVVENRLSLPADPAGLDISPDRNVIVGIRPEHIRPGTAEDRTSELEVINVEQLGNETLLSFEVGKEIWTAKWPGQWKVKAGERVPVHIPIPFLHFFDRETGLLIKPAQSAHMREVEKV